MRLITFTVLSVTVSQDIFLDNPVCSGWKQKSDCTDDLEGAVYWDEVFEDDQNIVIENQEGFRFYACIIFSELR